MEAEPTNEGYRTMTTRSMGETLRAVADLLDRFPDMPRPFTSAYDHTPHQADLAWYFQIREDEVERGQPARAGPGRDPRDRR